eukprot:2233223-Pyramimonas_sp.AAC.1
MYPTRASIPEGAPCTGPPSWAFVVLVTDSKGDQALLGYAMQCFDPGGTSNYLVSLLAEILAAQWALAWALQSGCDSLAISAYGDNLGALDVMRAGAIWGSGGPPPSTQRFVPPSPGAFPEAFTDAYCRTFSSAME